METSLSYRDEKDRCYGATGMAIGIVAVDGDEYITSVTIDGPADRMLEYGANFYFSRNPRLSAKDQWNQMLRSYNLSVVAMLANMMCRRMVLDGDVLDAETRRALHDIALDEGRESCSLEQDECERLFDKNLNYLIRIFSHRGVHSVAHDFAETLAQRRTLSRLEILDMLKALRMI